jgi:hypothetical protein
MTHQPTHTPDVSLMINNKLMCLVTDISQFISKNTFATTWNPPVREVPCPKSLNASVFQSQAPGQLIRHSKYTCSRSQPAITGTNVCTFLPDASG